jgi:hypothetical protein
LDKTYNVSTTNIQEQASKLKEIVGDGLAVGDIVEQEDIDVLKEAGVNIDTYFS